MPQATVETSTQGLARFREVQRLAYACAEAVAADLAPGKTEREVARELRVWLERRGVDDWFHLPFAWFGDRTAFAGLYSPHQFFPTDRPLSEGMPYILDVAPIMGGYAADIGYAGSLGDNAIQRRLLDDLQAHRRLILERVRAGDSMREVYDAVDRLLMLQGYDNRHRCYPFGVLAHKLERVEGPGASAVLAGFGLRTLGSFVRGLSVGRAGLWGPGTPPKERPAPGLWAVEPHVGFHGVGAKFEEILVVTDADAFWLDDDVPHMKRNQAS